MFLTQGPSIIAGHNTALSLWYATHPGDTLGYLLIGICAIAAAIGLLARTTRQS